MDVTFIDKTEKVPAEEIRGIENLLQFAAGFLEITEDTEVSVTFTDNAGIQMINHGYRGKDMPTDVISFALKDEEKGELPIVFDDEELTELPRNLGDLVISTERAAGRAVRYRHILEWETGFLAMHGFLYLNGCDHMEPEDEKEMLDLQREILDAYGLKRWANGKK